MRQILLLMLLLAPLSVFAQSLEDDDPNDRRYWGYSSRYSSLVAELGAARIENLPIPVLFGAALDDLTENFGDPRGGGTRTHQGLDIMAKEGTPIASPTDAIVLRTGNGTNSGLYIRTANPGGENFVYMHLSAIVPGIEAGDRVERGEIIGFVGNTGNASGGPAHLHLEIRSGGGALDPFPRLGMVFTDDEITKAIADARAKGIDLPLAYKAPLNTQTPTPTTSASANAFSTTLLFGETSADVRALQKFLIANAKGSAGTRLMNTGVTGYFGLLTRSALMEYQAAAGLAASGVVDEPTHALIFGGSGEAAPAESSITGFARDLELGMEGADVRELQKFLNARGFFVAESGDGSPGNETTYFGTRTRAALARFQASESIAPAAGYFGPKTRGHLAAL